MTTNNAPDATDGQAASVERQAEKTSPSTSVRRCPPNSEPSVSIIPPAGNVTAGTPVLITVNTDTGTRWTWLAADQACEDEPIVHYTETLLDISNVESIRDHRGGGGSYSITFPRPGDYMLSAAGVTSDGTHINAAPVTVQVNAAGAIDANQAVTISNIPRIDHTTRAIGRPTRLIEFAGKLPHRETQT